MLNVRGTLLLLSAAFAVSAIGSAVTTTAIAATPAKKDACAAKASKWDREQCEKYTHSAPGDEYFGRMKMSYLGINNTFRDEAIRAGTHTTDGGIINKVGFADEALNAWAKRFPGDPQLARSYYLGEVVYQKIWTKPAQDRAWEMMQIIVKKYPATFFGKAVKKNLAIGFTQHYYGDPQPCGAPTASPNPAPAKAGQPKVSIETPPCIAPPPTAPPASPSPSPTKRP